MKITFNKTKIIKGLSKAAAIARCRRTAAEVNCPTTKKFWVDRAKEEGRYYSGQIQAPGYEGVPFDF